MNSSFIYFMGVIFCTILLSAVGLIVLSILWVKLFRPVALWIDNHIELRGWVWLLLGRFTSKWKGHYFFAKRIAVKSKDAFELYQTLKARFE